MPVKTTRVTQADVARMADVSQTTVSMVINGTGVQQRRVSDEVRERVMAAVRESGYVANPIAQRLAGGRTSIVGVYTYESVFPHSAGNFYFPFLEGIEAEAERSEIDILMFTSTSSSGRSLSSGAGVGRLRVADGCVLLGRSSSPEDLAELLRQDFPFAFVGRREAQGGNVPWASAAYDDATREVVERLIGLGHRRVALLNEYVGHESMEDRISGYREAMLSARLEPRALDVPNTPPRELLEELRATGVTAVVTSPDLAYPLLTEARMRGLSVPDDLSIARLGDPERPVGTDVNWTGFLIPRVEMGAQALRLVLQQLTQESSRLQVRIPCETVAGSTIAPPRKTPKP